MGIAQSVGFRPRLKGMEAARGGMRSDDKTRIKGRERKGRQRDNDDGDRDREMTVKIMTGVRPLGGDTREWA